MKARGQQSVSRRPGEVPVPHLASPGSFSAASRTQPISTEANEAGAGAVISVSAPDSRAGSLA